MEDLDNVSAQQMKHRLESLQQENIVLKSEVETLKLKIRALQEDNLQLRQNSVNIQVKAEQEEEYISNKLLKKITELKKEKETLALNYEQEEEFLTNDLMRKLSQLRDEKANLEQTLEKEQKAQINKLTNRIQKLENDVTSKQKNLDTLRREKIELENALEQEQEGLVNRLWKKMEKLESEKRLLQSKLDMSISPVMTTTADDQEFGVNQLGAYSNENMDVGSNQSGNEKDRASEYHSHVIQLREEVFQLRSKLARADDDCQVRLRGLSGEERALQEENRRLRRQLQAEIERRQDMCRNLSESESSLEVDEERQFNERRKGSSSVLLGNTSVSGYPADSQLAASLSSSAAGASFNNSNSYFCGSVSSSNSKNRIRTTSDSGTSVMVQGNSSNITQQNSPGFPGTHQVLPSMMHQIHCGNLPPPAPPTATNPVLLRPVHSSSPLSITCPCPTINNSRRFGFTMNPGSSQPGVITSAGGSRVVSPQMPITSGKQSCDNSSDSLLSAGAQDNTNEFNTKNMLYNANSSGGVFSLPSTDK